MKTKAMITMLVSVAMILAAPLVALGAPGGGGGEAPPDYGDLIILYRDAYGVPIPSDETQVPDPETGLPVDGGLCWQPIAFNVVDLEACPAECVVESVPAGADVVSVDQYNCAVTTGCSGCTQEVDFGRINDARSDVSVFESQLEDVVVNLATADCITLDPAGRLVTSIVETVEGQDPVVSSGAIDSPLQNLAIYRQLMLAGTLGAGLDNIISDDNVLITAARALGAASGKEGWVGVDLVVYLNQIMGLTDNATTTILDPKICEWYREEVQGNIELVEKCFLNYGAVPPDSNAYAYHRGNNFEELPAPAYIPETQGGPAKEGWFEVLAPIDPETTNPFYQKFAIFRGPIFYTVFDNNAAGSGGSYAIGDFAQAADDTRATINYMHSWPLPVVYATPVSCKAHLDNVLHYDVSISPESGLQVPERMVAGTEGREFTVAVANAGPDEASVTVEVKAVTADNIAIPTFPRNFYFTLAPGTSTSNTEGFRIENPTTVTWTATATTPDCPTCDVIPGNNEVEETTVVTVSGGGGQRGRR